LINIIQMCNTGLADHPWEVCISFFSFEMKLEGYGFHKLVLY